MSQLKFTEDHEWARAEEDGSVTIGITSYAQENLGDIVYVEVPEVGTHIAVSEAVVVIESVKTAADIRMPMSGQIVAVNEALADSPETVNEDPMAAGWIIKIKPDSDDSLSALLTAEAYDALVGK